MRHRRSDATTRHSLEPRHIVGGAAALAALVGLGHVALTWHRYGRVQDATTSDPVLDRFMPRYEVAERHEVRVAAPADVTYAAAREVDLQRSRLAHAIFRARELLLGGGQVEPPATAGLVAQTLAMGWGVLAEDPGRRLVIGALTRPWEANVHFESVPPERFAGVAPPGYVKIIWTLAAEPLGPSESTFRTETRVVTTDAHARRRFRLYWTAVSPGIRLIRHLTLRLVKAEAERVAIASRG